MKSVPPSEGEKSIRKGQGYIRYKICATAFDETALLLPNLTGST